MNNRIEEGEKMGLIGNLKNMAETTVIAGIDFGDKNFSYWVRNVLSSCSNEYIANEKLPRAEYGLQMEQEVVNGLEFIEIKDNKQKCNLSVDTLYCMQNCYDEPAIPDFRKVYSAHGKTMCSAGEYVIAFDSSTGIVEKAVKTDFDSLCYICIDNVIDVEELCFGSNDMSSYIERYNRGEGIEIEAYLESYTIKLSVKGHKGVVFKFDYDENSKQILYYVYDLLIFSSVGVKYSLSKDGNSVIKLTSNGENSYIIEKIPLDMSIFVARKLKVRRESNLCQNIFIDNVYEPSQYNQIPYAYQDQLNGVRNSGDFIRSTGDFTAVCEVYCGDEFLGYYARRKKIQHGTIIDEGIEEAIHLNSDECKDIAGSLYYNYYFGAFQTGDYDLIKLFVKVDDNHFIGYRLNENCTKWSMGVEAGSYYIFKGLTISNKRLSEMINDDRKAIAEGYKLSDIGQQVEYNGNRVYKNNRLKILDCYLDRYSGFTDKGYEYSGEYVYKPLLGCICNTIWLRGSNTSKDVISLSSMMDDDGKFIRKIEERYMQIMDLLVDNGAAQGEEIDVHSLIDGCGYAEYAVISHFKF